MPDLSTREILENQFNGLTPIKRQNPQYGEKDYYYINPNRDRYSSLSDEDIAYVDSPDDPNPFLQQSSTTNPLSSSSLNEMGTNKLGLTGTSSLNNSSPLTSGTLSGRTNDTLSTSGSSSLNNSSFLNNSGSDLASNSLLGTSHTSSYASTANPLSSSTLSTTNSNSLTSPFSSSISATGLSTDNSLTTPTDEPSWYKGFGLSKTNSGLGFKYTSPFETNTTHSYMSTSNPLSTSSSNEMGTDTTGLTGTSSLNNSSPLTNDIFSTTRSSSSSDLTNNSLLGTNNNTVQVKTLYPPQINQTSSGQIINAVNYGEIWPTKKYLSSSTHNNSLDTPTKTYPLLSEVKNEIINANGVTRQIYDVYSLYNNINDGIEAVKMGYDVYSNFKNANKQLIQKYGRNTGAADGTDNYYHPLLMCKLAQKSPFSRNMGLYMGYGKEIADLSQKLTNKEKYPLSAIEYVKDSIKDLQNNLYGSKLGNYNPNISCEELLEPLRTENMRRENIQ